MQRRHQKIVEVAPAVGLPADLTQALYDDAVRITSGAGYVNAGTVEFLVDPKTWKHYFIEVNPRIQVEHTVTEVITGIDLVQSQIRVAAGQRLRDLSLTQDAISKRGYAIQARVTTEDPAADFRPDTGRWQGWRPAEGFGIRLDGGNAYPGAKISPFYDSMLMKVTASALNFEAAADKLARALTETRIRGVKTNTPFILNVLRHPDFVAGTATTSFIQDEAHALRLCGGREPWAEAPRLPGRARRQRPLGAGRRGPRHAARGAAAAHREQGAPPASSRCWSRAAPRPLPRRCASTRGCCSPTPPGATRTSRCSRRASAPRTSWPSRPRRRTRCTAATRSRTGAAPPSTCRCASCASARGSVSSRCASWCPTCPSRCCCAAPTPSATPLPRQCRAQVLRRRRAARHGRLRVFDSLNYLDNLKLGCDAVGSAGGVVEAAISYTGDISDPSKTKFTLDYYLDSRGAGGRRHPRAGDQGHGGAAQAGRGVDARRGAAPRVPAPAHPRAHARHGRDGRRLDARGRRGGRRRRRRRRRLDGRHDVAAVDGRDRRGARARQPRDGRRDGGLFKLIEYWESVRFSYAAFESGQKSGSSEVYEHEMPEGSTPTSSSSRRRSA